MFCHLILVCVGKVVLESLHHNYKIVVHSNNLRKRKRTKRKIKAAKNGHLIKFDVATITGNCCWKVRDKFISGQSFQMLDVGSYIPGWPIRAVKLVKRYNLN